MNVLSMAGVGQVDTMLRWFLWWKNNQTNLLADGNLADSNLADSNLADNNLANSFLADF